MKYLSSRFEEYIAENEKADLHENMEEIFNKFSIILRTLRALPSDKNILIDLTKYNSFFLHTLK